MKETDAEFGALCSKLEEDIKDNMDEDKLRAYEDCSFVTTKHAQMKSRLLNLLLSFMQQNEIKYADFLKPVIIGNEAVPSFFKIFQVKHIQVRKYLLIRLTTKLVELVKLTGT